MKKYFIDFLVGLVLGVIYLLLSTIFELDLIGVDVVLSQFSGTIGALLSGIWFVVLGIIPFLIYKFTPLFRKHHGGISPKAYISSFLSFSLGIYLSYFIFLLIAAIAFSQTTGPF